MPPMVEQYKWPPEGSFISRAMSAHIGSDQASLAIQKSGIPKDSRQGGRSDRVDPTLTCCCCRYLLPLVPDNWHVVIRPPKVLLTSISYETPSICRQSSRCWMHTHKDHPSCLHGNVDHCCNISASTGVVAAIFSFLLLISLLFLSRKTPITAIAVSKARQ
jgi:hypothetical protein